MALLYSSCLVLTVAMLFSIEGKTITAFLGESKVLQWTMDLFPTTDTTVVILHPMLVDTNFGKEYASLFSVLGTHLIKSDNDFARRVNNTKNTNANTGNIEFTLNDIREEDGGDYRTRFTPPGSSRITEIGIRLIVYVKPSTPHISEILPPVDGINMTLNCTTQSNSKPDDHGLQMTYKWYRNGSDLYTGDRYVISGSYLHMKSIRRTDTNTVLSCEAFETELLKSDVSAVYTVVVQYGPDSILLTPLSASYTMKENDKLHKIICISSCNPTCDYSWELDGNQVSSVNVLDAIQNIQRDQAGQYVCRVTNKHGSKETRVTVIVQYSPDTPVMIINGNNADVREGLPITLNCNTKSVPPAKLTIHGSNMTGLDIKNNTLTSTFTIPHTNCLDTGLFFCSAENTIGYSTSNGKNVNVLCKPRPDHRVLHIQKQLLVPGDTMNISGSLISNPQPTIYWSMQGLQSSVSWNLTNNEDNFVFNNYWNVPTIKSIATRAAMKPEHFGMYMLLAENAYGKYAMAFTITEKRTPDSPELVSLMCMLQKPVEITFKPQYDGGDSQKFSIGMKYESDAAFKDVGDTLPDNKENEMTLKGPILESGVLYIFHVTATNIYGTTSSKIQLSCFIDNRTEDMYRYGMIMLIIGLIALFATILLGIILRLRQKRAVQKSACPQCGIQKTHKMHDLTTTTIETQHYQDIEQTENGQRIGMAENRNVVYEGLGQQQPTVYETLNHGSSKAEQRKTQYANTMLN